MCYCFCDCILVLLAVLFPPLPVWCKRGLCSADSLINILLCCLGYFPGLIHSWYIISRYPEDQYIVFDEESQIYVPPNQHHHSHQHYYVAAASPSATSANGSSAHLGSSHHEQLQQGSTSNHNQYGAITDADNEQQQPTEAPPAYDNVINETAKNIH